MQDHTPQLPLFAIARDGSVQELPQIVPIDKKQIKDLAGQRFIRLAVLGYVGQTQWSQAKWLCLCDCGNYTVVRRASLISGTTKSCGCWKDENTAKRNATHGLCHTIEYRIWANVKTRCHNPNTESYKNYGGRGITMCEQWLNSFETFISDMGPIPSPKHSIDRINNNLGYYPENCRWTTRSEQANNKRNNRFLEHKGEQLTIAQWSRKLGIPISVLSSRVNKLRWTIEKTLTTPVKKR